MLTLQRILVPLDLSQQGTSSVPFAIQMAQPNTIIDLVFVLEPPTLLDGYAIYSYEQIYADLKKELEAKFELLVSELKLKYPNQTFDHHLLEDTDIAQSVIQYSSSNNVDLIVVSSHGRRGLNRVLMGSIAEELMRLSTIPVLVCKVSPVS
jgi:nucleotide-binding universal stress UspA family protein